MKNKVCFWTWASKDFEQAYQRMSASLKKFHPDIELIRFTEEDLENGKKEYPHLDLHHPYGYLSVKIGEKYDLGIHIDSDIVVCSPLSEVFECDYDVAYSPFYTAVRGDNGACPGFYASRSQIFNIEFMNKVSTDWKKYSDGDQGVMNEMLKAGKYKFKNLDCPNGSYATDNAHYIKTNLYIVDGKLYCAGKPIRILHITARWGQKVKQLDFKGEVEENVFNIINSLIT